jgi:HTH-type transcriptional repressor of NAD biosynthesis genes
LAGHYDTVFVPETAREIVDYTDTVIYEDLIRIADHQAEAIQEAIPQADGVLFIDTDVYTTLAYSRYLFGRELRLRPNWVTAAANHLCLFTLHPMRRTACRFTFYTSDKLLRLRQQKM